MVADELTRALIEETTLEDISESYRPVVDIIGIEKFIELSEYAKGDAKVVSVRQNGELYEATLKILDKNKQPDIRFPEVPKVKTDIPVLKNEIVAIVLMYGECKPYIIGRCF